MIGAKLNKRAEMRKLTRFAYFLMMENPKIRAFLVSINSVLILLQFKIVKI